jgi:SPP1 gp7 family putative phage head morphogenesis protein
MQQATRQAAKKKFGRKRELLSKAAAHYPDGAEREYIRIAGAYMREFKAALAERLPDIRAVLEYGGLRTDAADDGPLLPALPETVAVAAGIDKILDEIGQNFAERQAVFNLHGRMERLSKLNRKLSIAEWKRVVKRTLGINIFEGYYKGLKFQRLYDQWVADNVGFIKTIPLETLSDMRQVINDGYRAGSTTKSIAKGIQAKYEVKKHHALFIARDQIAKLSAKVTREQHEDAGVTEYVWRTMDDSRVRKSHSHLDGTRQKYSDPPVVDYKTGRRANPGEDYQCRCVALPVFNIEGVVLPWEQEEVK